MKPRTALTTPLTTALTTLLLAMMISIGLASSAEAAPPAPSDGIRVTSAPSQLHTVIGQHFTYQPQIVNLGGTSTDRLIAHLNVASLTSDVYVDPEDWSSNRSIVIPPLGPGAKTALTWEVQAVSAGSFAVYVVLLPSGAASSGTGALVVSPVVHVTVAARRTLNAGGSLPVVIAVPVLLAAAVAVTRLRTRRTPAT
jgi:hypothetical protein